MGVKAEAAGRVEELRAAACTAGRETEAGGGRAGAAVGEGSGRVDGRMDEAGVEGDRAADGAVEEGGSEAEDDGTLGVGGAGLMTSGGWSGDGCPGDESAS